MLTVSLRHRLSSMRDLPNQPSYDTVTGVENMREER